MQFLRCLPSPRLRSPQRLFPLGWLLALMLVASPGVARGENSTASRLADAPSPYLRQHADNPVDWYPWGEEAWAAARAQDKPLLVSVGYATCHWCHVMARESFEDPLIAALINRFFVPVKVDRELRPALDERLMTVTRLIQNRSGWPNTVFLTPDLKPFMALTYAPPAEFSGVVMTIGQAWEGQQRAEIIASADQIQQVVDRQFNTRLQAQAVTPRHTDRAAALLVGAMDPVNKGWGTPEKFPREPILSFLLSLAAQQPEDSAARTAALETLDQILFSALHDPIGGGFHRYTVDPAWRVLHFEKMLYNQAQMMEVLVQAYELTGQERYAEAIHRTAAFVLREMTDPSTGAFWSALDAQSLTATGEKAEGAYYVWMLADVEAVLGAQRAEVLAPAFGISFEPTLEGGSIPWRPQRTPLSEEQEAARQALLAARQARPYPSRDEKVLLGWNGLMIRALAKAGQALDRAEYVAAAGRAADFLWAQMRDEQGRLARSHFAGATHLEATQADHAFLALAAVALDDAGRRPDGGSSDTWLMRAAHIADRMHARFWNEQAGGGYRATADQGGLSGDRSAVDGALPSGESAALRLFTELDQRLVDPVHAGRREAVQAALSGLMVAEPSSHAAAYAATGLIQRGQTGARQVLSGGRGRARLRREAGDVVLVLDLLPGWHVNGPEPLGDFLVGTEAVLEGSAEPFGYPPPRPVRLGISEEDLLVYEGQVRFIGPAVEPTAAVRVSLLAQLCNDSLCLAPEQWVLSLPPRGQW